MYTLSFIRTKTTAATATIIIIVVRCISNNNRCCDEQQKKIDEGEDTEKQSPDYVFPGDLVARRLQVEELRRNGCPNSFLE